MPTWFVYTHAWCTTMYAWINKAHLYGPKACLHDSVECMHVVMPKEMVNSEPMSKNFVDVISHGKEGVQDVHLNEVIAGEPLVVFQDETVNAWLHQLSDEDHGR